DLGDPERALRWDTTLGGWRLLDGDPAELRLSRERQAILEALRQAGAPQGPKAVADATGLAYDVVRHLLIKLAQAGQVASHARGLYIYPIHIIHNVHNGEGNVNDVNDVNGGYRGWGHHPDGDDNGPGDGAGG